MALQCFPNISKQVQLKDGIQYAYVHIAAKDSKPTFLFLHGFPSTSYDWRHQIKALSSKGFGVLAPDLLGYGDTDSPAELEAYSFKLASDHIAEIISIEGVGKVIGVGHDWGSNLLSRVYTWHPECLLATIFISVGYIEPTATPWDLGTLLPIQHLKEIWQKHRCVQCHDPEGFRILDLWLYEIFDTEEAAAVLDANPESLTSLVYPFDNASKKVHWGPIGAAEAWLKAGKTSPRPTWLTEEELRMHEIAIRTKGYQGPLNWYKSGLRGVDLAEHTKLSEDRKFLNLPTLIIVSSEDYVTRPEMSKNGTAAWTKDLKVEELVCGHWIQLEKPEEVNQFLEEFALGL